MMTTVAANARHSNSLDPGLQSSSLWQLKLYAPKHEAMARLTELDAALPETQLITDPDGTMALLPKIIPLPVGTEVPTCILGSAKIPGAVLPDMCLEVVTKRPFSGTCS